MFALSKGQATETVEVYNFTLAEFSIIKIFSLLQSISAMLEFLLNKKSPQIKIFPKVRDYAMSYRTH